MSERDPSNFLRVRTPVNLCHLPTNHRQVSVGIILGYFVSSFAPSMDAANAILPVYSVTLLFFCGFLIRFDSIPPWWQW